MTFVVTLDAPASQDPDTTGGKGANLARMSGAGFPVPRGFVIATSAYREFIEAAELWPRIESELATADFADAATVEAATARVRELIESTPVPADIAEEIKTAYDALGDDTFVAVRSSGTAEDLAEASFAGQHDTYLDILGPDDLLTAVRRCWGSLWTSRATAYRDNGHFAQADVALAVVVQEMIESEVSGVMFTANPMSTAVDEFVINAAYGLGEGIVSGILTPDQYTIDRDTYEVIDQLIGGKATKVHRIPGGKHTTISRVDPALAKAPALTPAQIAELGRLGAAVTEYYDGWPQDIEWAYAAGTFHLLQSRDVTGVDLTWDEDLEEYMPELPRIDRAEILTRAFADSVWQGRVTPMGYSLRCEAFHPMITRHQEIWGTTETAKLRIWKYHKGEVYYTGRQEFENMVSFLPPTMWNPALLGFTQPSLVADLEKQEGNWFGYAKALIRIRMIDADLGPYRFFTNCYRQMKDDGDRMLGPGIDELRKMSDRELVRAVDRAIKNQHDWVEDLWSGFFLHATTLSAVFVWMLGNWYKGSNPHIFNDLITGLPEPTITLKENLELWELGEKIRTSPALTEAFTNHPGAEFFTAVADAAGGEQFLDAYRDFLTRYGHRGHADRDISYPRRSEAPELDYNSLKVFVASGG